MQEPRATAYGETPDSDVDRALQDGLRCLSVPPTSPAFDDRVLASLAMPEQASEASVVVWISALRETVRAWWNGPSLQLMLSGAACAVLLTLGAYGLSVHAPVAGPTVAPAGAGVAAASFPEFFDPAGPTAAALTYRGLLLGVPRAVPAQGEPRVKPDRRRGSGATDSSTPRAAVMPGRAKADGREA